MDIIAYCDGGCKNNGGMGAQLMFYSFKIFEGDKEVFHAERERINWEDRPQIMTNNLAEVWAFFITLSQIKNLYQKHPERVRIYSDSEILCKQFRGVYKIKTRHLKEVYSWVFTLADYYKRRLSLEWVPRAKIVEVLGH